MDSEKRWTCEDCKNEELCTLTIEDPKGKITEDPVNCPFKINLPTEALKCTWESKN